LSIDNRRNGIANIHIAIGSEELSESSALQFSVDVFTDIEPQPRSVANIVVPRTGMRCVKIDI
jgi:hypothetical protein